MTDEQLSRIISKLETPQAKPDNKLILTVLGGLALFYITGSLNEAQKVSGVVGQIENLVADVGELKNDLNRMEITLSNSRVDPFTGSMGNELRNEITDEIEEVESKTSSKLDLLDDRLRVVESKVHLNSLNHPAP